MAHKTTRILITGARGFIGKNLVEHLSSAVDKYELFYPYHNELELLDEKSVRRFINTNQIDVIIHCAKVGGSRRSGYDAGSTDVIYKNLCMFFNLASCLDKQRKMIFLGSGIEYDYRCYKPRMKEDYFGSSVPIDPYGFSKFVCSRHIEHAANLVNLRIFGVFGKYEDHECRFISNAILKNLFKLPIVINQNLYFDYTYVNDLVKIIEYFISHKPKYKFYNVTCGKTIDLITIAKKINRLSEYKSRLVVRNKGLNVEYSADNGRLLKELKNFKFTDFDSALKELYFWYRENLHNFNRMHIAKDEYLKYCRRVS